MAKTYSSQSLSFPQDWSVPVFDAEELAPKSKRYAVCVFVINEGEKIRKQLRAMAEYSGSADLVVADGGSTDGSLDLDYLKQMHVRALLTKREKGKLGTQMRMAFAWCLAQGYEGVIVVDGNNKDDMSAIPVFVRALDEGIDHVQGSRFVPGGKAVNTPMSRVLGLHILHAPVISLAARRRYTDTTNGFRAYSKKLLVDPRVAIFRPIFTGYEVHYYLAIRAARLKFRVQEVPVTRSYPKHEATPTKISPIKGNMGIIKELFKAASGYYDPDSTPRNKQETR